MEPNNNSTSTPNPAPSSGPALNSTPNTDLGANPAPAPAGPAAPTNPATPVEPVSPVPGASASPEPSVSAQGVQPVAAAASGITAPPVNPIINPSGANGGGVAHLGGVAATDPIMMPEPAPAPDPVEEELKAPMKAAAPVPGSIGSAVSGPASAGGTAENPFADDKKQTPNVAFNDPATQPEVPAGAGGPTEKGEVKKKNNKTTLIALIIVAAMIVIALAGVLIMQLMSDNGSSTSTTPNNPAAIEPEEETEAEEEGATNAEGVVAGSLNCTRDMTAAEVARYDGATTGTIDINMEFDETEQLASISSVSSVIYDAGEMASGEPVEAETHQATAVELDAANALNFYLSADEAGNLDLSMAGLKANYESLAFVCKVL